MKRNFTSTVFVFDRQRQKFLMVFHRRLKKWMPPGGHLEMDENPVMAARREVLEETGLDIELVGAQPLLSLPTQLPLPFSLDSFLTEGDSHCNEPHEHLNFVYLGLVSDCRPRLNLNESTDLQFFSAKEIQQTRFDTFEDVRRWSQAFSDLLIKIS